MPSPTSDISVELTQLRERVASGETRPLATRLARLAALDDLLREHGADLQQALVADLGKSPTESWLTEIGVVRAEIRHVRRHLPRWGASRRVGVPWQLWPARAEIGVDPLGVMCIIAPWNYPVQLLLSPLVGAIAAGNAAVLKPSELAPRVAQLLARLMPQYVDLAMVIEGGPQETAELLRERFDHIVYTGGARVARQVMAAAARHLTPVTLELGGKSPAWIDDSTELPRAARRIAWGKFVNAGQTCIAPDYVLGTPAVLRELEPLLEAAIREMYGHAPRRHADYGRIINADHTHRLVSLLNGATHEGARVVVGGDYDVATRYVAPTVLADVTWDSPLMAEEIFGPLLPLVAVPDLPAAVREIRRREKPLAIYAFTNRADVRRQLRTETSSGALVFDAPLVHAGVPALPFGGVGGSGIGAYHGRHSVRAFSHSRAILAKPLRPDTLRLLRPPFSWPRRLLTRWLL